MTIQLVRSDTVTHEEIDMENALDNVIDEFKVSGKIENGMHIDYIREAYKHVNSSMMRDYARKIGGQGFVNEIDKICR